MKNTLFQQQNAFWKHPCDVKNMVKTQSQTKNKPTVDFKTFDDDILEENGSIDGYLA